MVTGLSPACGMASGASSVTAAASADCGWPTSCPAELPAASVTVALSGSAPLAATLRGAPAGGAGGRRLVPVSAICWPSRLVPGSATIRSGFMAFSSGAGAAWTVRVSGFVLFAPRLSWTSKVSGAPAGTGVSGGSVKDT